MNMKTKMTKVSFMTFKSGTRLIYLQSRLNYRFGGIKFILMSYFLGDAQDFSSLEHWESGLFHFSNLKNQRAKKFFKKSEKLGRFMPICCFNFFSVTEKNKKGQNFLLFDCNSCKCIYLTCN